MDTVTLKVNKGQQSVIMNPDCKVYDLLGSTNYKMLKKVSTSVTDKKIIKKKKSAGKKG